LSNQTADREARWSGKKSTQAQTRPTNDKTQPGTSIPAAWNGAFLFSCDYIRATVNSWLGRDQPESGNRIKIESRCIMIICANIARSHRPSRHKIRRFQAPVNPCSSFFIFGFRDSAEIDPLASQRLARGSACAESVIPRSRAEARSPPSPSDRLRFLDRRWHTQALSIYLRTPLEARARKHTPVAASRRHSRQSGRVEPSSLQLRFR
jgi:hypothetical protein